MEGKGSARGTPDGDHHSGCPSPTSLSHDSALPTSTTIPSIDLDDGDDHTDESPIIVSPSRSKSNESRRTRIDSSATTSADRLKHGIRYLTDGFIRKMSKQNQISRIQTLNLNNLRDKKIRYIENLQSLTNLEVLDLSNNLIERIDGLKTLKKLKQLYLGKNFIRTITNLEDLHRLEVLDLQQNQINEIPVWLSKRLTNLRTLNLSDNEIASFDQIARLRTAYELRQVYFQGNPVDQHEHYRLLMISYIPSLEQIDGIDVTDVERQQAKEQFIQQEVQNLLHELERRDHECRRLNHQATSNGQKLEMTSDKLQSLETKSSNQAKEIQDLRERLSMSESLLQRKTTLLHQACEKQCQLEQELAFYKIDLKFDRFDLSKHVNRKTNTEDRPSPIDGEGTSSTNKKTSTPLQWQVNEVQRILGRAPNGKFHRPEDETIYNEKLLKLAFHLSELTFLQAKQEIIEGRLEHEPSQAVINQLSDELTEIQCDMMNKISDVQELKLFLHGLRTDSGDDLTRDLEQVTIELKLDEVVQQHVIRMKERRDDQTANFVVTDSQSTFEQVLTDAVSSTATSTAHDPPISSSSSTILNEPNNDRQVLELQQALEREQAESRQRIEQIEQMAEREKQRILKHLEDEKRFTRDIIEKSETMIDQLKRELSSERQRKSAEQKAQDSLRDIYKKISPQHRTKSNKSTTNDDDDESHFDGETTVYHKDDPLLASTPRDRSFVMGKSESSEYTALQRLQDESEDDSEDESILNIKSKLRTNSLPPTPKRRSNTLTSALERTPSLKRTVDHSTGREVNDQEEQDLLYRLHGFVKTGQVYMSKLGDLARTPVNDSGYSSQQTGRDGNLDNPKYQSLLSTQTFMPYQKTLLDPLQFDRDFTVGVVTNGGDHRRPSYPSSARFNEPSRMGNVTLYPTPEGYMLGPHSVTVSGQDSMPIYKNRSPSQSITQTDSQYFACVNIPPSGLSSNRPLFTSEETTNNNEVRLQGPVIFRQDTILPSENVSPVSVKIRSLKFPQVEKGTMTDADSLRRDIDRTSDEIDYLKSKLQRQEQQCQDDNQYHLFRDILEQQTRDLRRVQTLHEDLMNVGRDSETNRADISSEIQRIRRNVHEHLSPNLLQFLDGKSQPVPSNLIPLNQDEHWICTVPRHADLEMLVTELQEQIDEQRRHIAAMKHDNRRLERSLVKKSAKIDALDLAASTKRAKSIADRENLQDDVFILEQQLIRKQRDLTIAQEQLKQMTSLSQQVIHDLKSARQRHTIAKRETKIFDRKVELLTRKLYQLTTNTKQAEERFIVSEKRMQIAEKEVSNLEKTIDEKRALTIVLDEQ